ncbi:MAG: hypothetical protein IT230_12865 [Flavobacteriales bacterium]|nr:hypothetical protein [Flavobacteriales bacterium]
MPIYLDENLSEYVAQGLQLLSRAHYRDIEVISTKQDKDLGPGVKDPDLIPIVAKKHGVLITKDIRMRTTMLFQLCQQNKLGIFFLKMPSGKEAHWDIVRVLVEHWEEIVKHTRKEKRPFAFVVKPRGKMEKLS